MDRFSVTAEIFDILDDICHVHRLPLALTWVCYGNGNDLNLNKKRILCIEDSACYVNDLDKQGFVKVCATSHLEEGRGVAGKALQSIKCSVLDVTALDIVDYPFVGDARKFGLRSAFAIGLNSKRTSCDYYVLEFFLPGNMIERQFIAMIDELSRTLHERCKDWKTVSLLESNEAYRSENGFEEVHRRPLPPSSEGGLNLNEMMNPRNDEMETCEPYEQEVRDQNNTVGLAGDFAIPVVKPYATKQVKYSSKRKKTSEVWKSFDKVEENGAVWAICKGCNRKYPGESTKGTSNLHKHLKKCSMENQRDAELGGSKTTVVENNFLFDQERSRLDIARMIIKHGYPLDIVERKFFEIFVKNLQPMFKINSQDEIKSDVFGIYTDEKEKLRKYFDSNLSFLFSFTIDLQPYDDKKTMYCCLMLHFIDEEWGLKKKIIAFKHLGQNYDVGTLHEVIKGVLMEWNIHKNVHFVVAEIAPPNDQMVGKLKSMLTSQVSVLGKDLFFLSCCAQFLNHLVQDGLHEIKSVLLKIRESVEYVTGTPLNRHKFQEAINQVKLQDKKMVSLDVPTSWDTTFLMLEGALGLRRAFAQLEQFDLDFVLNLSMEELNQATVICECLKVFHDSICTSCKSIYVYFVNLCSIYKKLLQWEKSEHAYVQSMAKRMKVKFDKYWSECSFPLGVIAVLDPRFKFDFVEYAYEQMFGADDARGQLLRFRDDLTCVYNKYASSIGNVSYNPNFGDKECTFREWRKRKYDSNTVHSQKKELDQYLEQPPENLNEDIDVLAWWRSNTPKFPVLARMARDFLAIPKSTYAFKSTSINEVMRMNPTFSDLGPEIIEALICGQDWLETPGE